MTTKLLKSNHSLSNQAHQSHAKVRNPTTVIFMKNIFIPLALLTALAGPLQASSSYVFPPVEPITETFQQSPNTLSIVNNITGLETLLPHNVQQPATRQRPPVALLVLILCIALIATLFIRPQADKLQNP